MGAVLFHVGKVENPSERDYLSFFFEKKET